MTSINCFRTCSGMRWTFVAISRAANTVLRSVHVTEPGWSKFTPDEHLAIMAKVSARARALGKEHNVRTKHVTTEVVKNADYDRVIGGE